MASNDLCPNCGCDYKYCYCVSNVDPLTDNATIPIDFTLSSWSYHCERCGGHVRVNGAFVEGHVGFCVPKGVK